MSSGKFPGPIGMPWWRGCVLRRGPIGDIYGDDFYFPYFTPGPTGTGNDAGEAAAESSTNKEVPGEEELKLLVSVYKSVKNKRGNRSYSYINKGKRVYRSDEYFKDRNDYFGSEDEYLKFLKKAREELEADKQKLRRQIVPSIGKRKNLKSWEEAQDVFYAWVKKAYQKNLGENTDVPKLIKARMSEKLKEALKQVKLDYGEEFKAGGFNPRPMKKNGYRLGTISEHALGKAIDIDHAKNAHITREWPSIVAYTGKTYSQSASKNKWKTKPKDLFDEIKGINDEFVRKVSAGKKGVLAVAKKAAEAPGATAKHKQDYEKIQANSLDAAIAADAALAKIGKGFIKRWQNGFFALPWALVKELHEEDFLWGATFSHPDLHHFEL